MKNYRLPNEVMLSETEAQHLRACVAKLVEDHLRNALGPQHTFFGRSRWSITTAEFCDAESYLAELAFFQQNCPEKYQELCAAIGDRVRIGVFQFQLKRSKAEKHLPKSIVGTSLLVRSNWCRSGSIPVN